MKIFPLSMLLVTSIVCFFACKEKKNEPVAAPKKPGGALYDAIVAGTYPLNRTVQAPGTILPNETTDLQTEISGRVVSINFKEGSYVKAGVILVKLFDADLQAQLKKLSVQLKVAESTEKRQKELLAINGTSQQDYDNAVLNVSNIKADMELLRVNISKTEIKAPYDGKLGLRNISLGAYVTPSTIITNISQITALKAEFSIPEKYAAEMVPGKAVTMHTSTSAKQFNANIIASQNVIETETRNLVVRARLQNPDASLSPGSFVEVDVNVGGSGQAIMIPTEAIIPSTRFKKVIVNRQGMAAFQIVNTGFRDSARIEILSGIQEGDTILTSGLMTVKEGMPLKVKVSNK